MAAARACALARRRSIGGEKLAVIGCDLGYELRARRQLALRLGAEGVRNGRW